MFRFTEKDVFEYKLKGIPIDIRKIKNEDDWLLVVEVLSKCQILTVTGRDGVLAIQYPILGIMQATGTDPAHEVTLPVGSFVNATPPKTLAANTVVPRK